MATLDEIGQKKQRVSERLVWLDTERARLADQLGELEIAERVLRQFGERARRTGSRRRGGLATTAPAASGERSAPGTRRMATVALRDAVLKAVAARPQGITVNEVLAYLSQQYSLKIRPNHLGVALHRHHRAGRLELRDQRWYLPVRRD